MGERNETVDALRAVAALAVCLFHFTRFELFEGVSVLSVCRYGGLGVEVFFVISGFIVPYAMVRAGYTLRAWPTFMGKRLLRLEPPYLVSIALVLALDAITTLVTGGGPQASPWSAAQVASHVGYLTGLLGLDWLNLVYWSLAIELQFYLLCSLLTPVLALLRREHARVAVVLGLAALASLVPGASDHTLMPYLPIFGLGLLVFLVQSALVGRASFWIAMGALVALLAGTLPLPSVIAGTATALVIACVRMRRIAPVAWLGTLSYSLYLVHVPIGGRLIMLGGRLGASAGLELLLVGAALALSLGVAYVLFLTVERPSRTLAARIRYGRPSFASPVLDARVLRSSQR